MPVDNDKPLRVTHASGNVRHAILYLQGMCSDAKSADGWVDLASERGTVIALRPDVSCLPERQGYKWPTEPGLIEARVERALELVREARGGLLDVDVVTLFGYSQGSGRAELLASRRPKRYSRVVLGGHPSVVYVPHFAGVERVAFLGGELEKTEDMRASSAALARAGVESQFFLLPGAAHGSYGPDQRRIVPDVFDWLGVPSVSP
jgi:pimeloyl-ACP methyl ester carboxylesterase